jgi:phage terminase small subunit
MALTPKQALFVKEYLIDLNATQAAIRAGYSEKTAYSIGEENLKKPEIAEAIAEHQQAKAKKLDITVDTILAELEEARQLALETGKAGPAVQASMGKAKILGLEKQVIDHTSSDGTMTPKAPIVVDKDTAAQVAANINGGI